MVKTTFKKMKKEILLLIVLISSGFLIYSLIPTPTNITKNTENNRENVNIESQNKIRKKIEENFLSFDVVRITRKGDAVIAGRSRPNEEIIIFDGDVKLANIVADINGEWVWISESPLKPGIKRLFLSIIDDNGDQINSDQTVIVYLESNDLNNPFVLKSSIKGENQSLLLNLEQINEGVVLDLVEYSPIGNIMLSGRSESNIELNFFLNNKKIGNTKTDDWGFWSFVSDKNMKFGKHDLRIDSFSNKGLLSITTPIFNEKMSRIINSLENKKIIVQPGNSLWRIARKTLGGGIMYSEIYKKNKFQIQNPDLIFPGQIFDIPIITGKSNYE